jgi:hypothetical protein
MRKKNMPCNCEEKIPMEQSQGEKILVTYMHPSTGRTQVYGASTKTYYGYRKRGDQFMAFRADALARPDLLLPVDQRELPQRVVGLRGRTRPQAQPRQAPPSAPLPVKHPPQEKPPPPTPWTDDTSVAMTKPATGYDLSKVEIRTIDWGRRLNKSQVRALYQANVRTLKDAVDKDRDGLTAIKGVGEKIADTLLEEAVRLSSE